MLHNELIKHLNTKTLAAAIAHQGIHIKEAPKPLKSHSQWSKALLEDHDPTVAAKSDNAFTAFLAQQMIRLSDSNKKHKSVNCTKKKATKSATPMLHTSISHSARASLNQPSAEQSASRPLPLPLTPGRQISKHNSPPRLRLPHFTRGVNSLSPATAGPTPVTT